MSDDREKMGIPRRNCIDKMVPAELAITNVIRQIETMGADVRLTEAQILLGQARDKVADYVDDMRGRGGITFTGGGEPDVTQFFAEGKINPSVSLMTRMARIEGVVSWERNEPHASVKVSDDPETGWVELDSLLPDVGTRVRVEVTTIEEPAKVQSR